MPEINTHFLALTCDFESDFCGFEVSGSKAFNFTREQAGHIVNSEDGPMLDHTGSRNGYFAYIFSGSGNQNSQTEIETHMIHGANHELECFSFWFAIKVGVGITSNTAAEYYCYCYCYCC